jgi:hypothetical protein
MQEVFAGTKDGGCDNEEDKWIKCYSYLRGLDGLAADRKRTQPKPTSSDNDDNQPKSADQGATPGTAGNFEGAEGQSQYDYLYRLDDRLDDWDKKLRREGEGKIDAVGVLGSDVYDKLLILQALRPKFPEALFFTTDLDALLLPQGKSRYTRGLLVASAYDLRLSDELQRDIPPFRSNYETSAFLATRLAVETESSGRKGKGSAKAIASNDDPMTGASCDTPVTEEVDVIKAWNCSPHQPRLFPIGLTAARALAVGSPPDDGQSGETAANKACYQAELTKCASIQPPVPSFYPKFSPKERIGLSLIPALLSILLFGFFPEIRKVCFYRIGPRSENLITEMSLTRLRVVIPILLIILVLGLYVFLFLLWDSWADWLTDHGPGEPMTLFEGISLWPTIAVRAFAIVLLLFLVWYTLRSLEMSRYDIRNEFSVLAGSVNRSEILRSDVGMLKRWCMRLVSLFWLLSIKYFNDKGKDKFGRKNIPFTWMGRSNSWFVRSFRASIYTILMMGVWEFVLIPIFGEPYAPARGGFAHSVYDRVTLINVILTLFLVFLVVDATLYAYAFTKRLTQISTVWPPETIANYRNRFILTTRDGLSDFIDMKYLEEWTRCITPLVYFPFVALAVLMLSRNWLFDDFSMEPTVLIAQAICVVAIIALVCAYRSAAEKARTEARRHLTARITAAKSSEETTPHAEQLQMMLDEIDKLNEGAFAPLTSQPIVKAILLPLITYGGTWLLHIYALPGN